MPQVSPKAAAINKIILSLSSSQSRAADSFNTFVPESQIVQMGSAHKDLQNPSLTDRMIGSSREAFGRCKKTEQLLFRSSEKDDEMEQKLWKRW